MSDDPLFRLRITEDEEKGSWSFDYNFHLQSHSEGISETGASLLNLSDDWLDYCLASLRVSPRLVFFGSAVVQDVINRRLIPDLDSISIARELNVCSESERKEHSYVFDEQDLQAVEKKLQDLFRLERASDSISRSQLSSVIAEFEFFIVRMAKTLAKVESKRYLNGAETVTVAELLAAETPESIIAKKVEKKIRDEMRGSHDEIIKWMVEVMDLGDLSSITKSPLYADFMEACQRRHILAHNGGVVNSQYVDKCLEFGVKARDIPGLGEKIRISSRYLKRTSGRAFMLGLFMLHIKVQKLGEEDRIASLLNLLSASHDFLVAKQTKMCVRVLDFAEQQKKPIPMRIRLSFGINRALAELFDPNKSPDDQLSSAKKVLDKYDWSVTTPLFDLALACVRREFEGLIDLAQKAQQAGLDHIDASTFVVFSEARKVPGFMDCFPRKPLKIPFSPD